MPTLHRLRNAKIQVFARDHNPPHFRLIGPNSRCNIAIRTLEDLVGYAAPDDLAEARAWAMEHRDLLMRTWESLNAPE